MGHASGRPRLWPEGWHPYDLAMEKPGEFPFVVLNDLHYMSEADRPWLEGLVRRVNETPGFLERKGMVLVLGDLAELGTREELAAAKGILNGLKAPYFVVPGNHDGPPERPIGSGAAGLKDYEELFPGRRNYYFVYKGWQFLGLDTTNGSGYEKLPIPTETRAYAQHATAMLDAGAPTILFTHMPLDPKVRFSSSEGYELLTILSGLNLRIVFSGHYHGLSESRALGNPNLRLVTNRCCSRTRELHDGSTLRGYYQCEAKADETVEYWFVEYGG